MESARKYLTKQEYLACEDSVTIAQLTQNKSERRRLESNAGPYLERQTTTRDEHEIYPADPEATVVHDSSCVQWRAAPGRSGEGGGDLDCAGDVGIIGDAQAVMSCRVAGQDLGSAARQAFAPCAALDNASAELVVLVFWPGLFGSEQQQDGK